MASEASDDDLVFVHEWRNAIEHTIKSFPNVQELKPVQEEALISFIQRRDVMAVLPTGSGKSHYQKINIFQVVPGVVRYLSEKGFSYPQNPIIIVVCPLNALIASHLKELEKYGISACSLTDEYVEDDVKAGKFSVIFANPESLVNNKKWRKMLQSTIYQENVFGFVTDEAHVVPKWGKGNAKEKVAAFRQSFLRLGEVRSLLPVGSPVLALTATATAEVRKETMEGLNLKPSTHQIVVSPDRPNIYLYKAKVNKSLDCFKWLIANLQQEKINTPRTIVYCKSQKHCGRLYRHFKLELGANAYYPDGAKPVSQNALIGMYHANTLEKYKAIVSDSLFDSNGLCRVIFATTALGMGINVKDIRQVIHYGPPREMDDFVQEIGRAGRDGKASKSILFYTGNHLTKCSSSIKNYAKSSKDCLREILLEEFGESSQARLNHDCCVICHTQCACSGTGCEIDQPSFLDDSSEQPRKMKTRKVTKEHKQELRELLIDYQKQLEMSCPAYVMSSQSTTVFSDALIKSVLKNLKNIFALEDLMELTPVYKKSHAIDIMFMVKDVCEDFELNMDFTHNTSEDELDLDFDYLYGGHYDSADTSNDNSENSDNDSVASMASEMSGLMELL